MEKLTKKELEILLDHFRQDWEYAMGGTFGDGVYFTDSKGNPDGSREWKKAEKIIKKLTQILKTK